MKKNKAAVTATTFLVSIALMFSTAATASANPIYDYALHVLNSRVECEQTLKKNQTHPPMGILRYDAYWRHIFVRYAKVKQGVPLSGPLVHTGEEHETTVTTKS